MMKAKQTWQRIMQRGTSWWQYCSQGIWDDTRDKWWIKVIKTVNLTVRSFLNRDLQTSACAMTYRTLLAIVPALALIVALGRGFGVQNLIESHLSGLTAGQDEVVQMVMGFVDSYLTHASEGIFVGVGIVFLLATLVILLSSVEQSFNFVWGVRKNRTWWRKIADYTAILIILPVILLCSSGLTLVMSTALKFILPFEFMSPVINVILELASWVLTWLFFTGAYILIPHTKVKFMPALIGGILAGTAFRAVGWIFISGQMYVTKYNAIYGSFSFLPLLLIWLQLAWIITLTGALLTSSIQNVNRFNFIDRIEKISHNYFLRCSIAVLTVIVTRFREGKKALTIEELSQEYDVPYGVVEKTIHRMIVSGLLMRAIREQDNAEVAQPAMSIDHYTVSQVIRVLDTAGEKGFIPGFKKRFASIDEIMDNINEKLKTNEDIPLTSITINN